MRPGVTYKTRTVTVRVNEALQDAVLKYCKKTKLTIADVILLAIEEVCSKYQHVFNKV